MIALAPGLEPNPGGDSPAPVRQALCAAQHGTPVLYVSLDGNHLVLPLRFLGELAGVDWRALYTGQTSSDDIDAVHAAKRAYSGMHPPTPA